MLRSSNNTPSEEKKQEDEKDGKLIRGVKKWLKPRYMNGEVYKDHLISVVETYIEARGKLVQFTSAVIAVTLWTLFTIFTLVNLSISMVSGVLNFSVLKNLSNYAQRIPEQIMFIFMIFLAAIISGVSRLFGALAFIATGIIVVSFAWLKDSCLRYFAMGAGIIQILFGILRLGFFEVKQEMLITIISFSSIATLVLLLGDYFIPIECNKTKSINGTNNSIRGSGDEKDEIFY